jgi:hypothetical protein
MGAGVILEAGAELKENPVAKVGVVAGVLRSMTLTPDIGMADGVCALLPMKEEDRGGGKEADGAAGNDTGGVVSADPGLKAGGVEQAGLVALNVTVESKRTVLMPSGPMDVKADEPFDTTGFEAGVNVGAGDVDVTMPPKLKLDDEGIVGVAGEKGDAGTALEGTIPPKLNVLEDDAEPNCRLFSLITDGEAAGELRLMIGGLSTVCGGVA